MVKVICEELTYSKLKRLVRYDCSVERKVEPIDVFTANVRCDHTSTKSGYLGIQLESTCSSTFAVRCGTACSAFDLVNTPWRSSTISTDVKERLRCALVQSVMC